MSSEITKRVAVILALAGVCVGCKIVEPHLVFRNQTENPVHLFINTEWPDSSLALTRQHALVQANTADTLVVVVPSLNPPEGITLFVFDAGFVFRHAGANPRAPFDFLLEDSILARYHYSERELDRLKMTLSFPPSRS